MTELPILVELGYVVGAATVALVAARLVRLPPIVGYMLAGLALGPLTGVLAVSDSVELFSELGVALLLFLVGLELSVDRIRQVGGSAVTAGLLQMLATGGLGAAIALWFGFSATEAVFLGLAVTFSSTVVVVKLLDRAGDLDERHGRLAIGILLVQDVAVALVLTVVTGLAGEGGGEGLASAVQGLGGAAGGLAVLVAVAAAAVRWGLPRLLAWLSDVPDGLFVASLAWCLAFILGAEALHLSVELGAFVAGVALAQLPQAHELARRVHPLVDFFVAVFFVALGAGLDLGAGAAHLAPALVLSAFVLVGKPLIVGALLGWLGHSDRTGLLAGLTLGQISEFAFVLAGMAVAAGMLEPDVLSLVGIVGLVTIGVSAAAVPQGESLYGALRESGGGVLRIFGRAAADPGSGPERAGHVVVVGMNALGRAVVRALAERGEEVVAVDSDRDKLAGLGAEAVVGDIGRPSVLDQTGVARAKLVVSALRIQDANSLLTYRCRRLGVPVSVNAFDASVTEELAEIGADHMMDPKHEAVRGLVEALRSAGALG